MLFFTEREKLEHLFIEWAYEHGVRICINSFIAYAFTHDLLNEENVHQLIKNEKGYYDGLNHRGEGKYIKLDDLIPVLAAWVSSEDDFQAVLDAVNQLDVTLL